MSKFKVRVKLEKFELEIEGSRDDVPLITDAVGQQIAGLLVPATDIVEGEIAEDSQPETPASTQTINVDKKPRARTRKPKSQTPSREETQPLAWRHDPSKWGAPRQGWNTASKSIWLLYVVSKETDTTELTTGQIVATFNTHFKQAKTITSSNVTRDLGRQKVTQNPPVSEDTTKTPSTWYLTQVGLKRAEELIAEAKGSGTENS